MSQSDSIARLSEIQVTEEMSLRVVQSLARQLAELQVESLRDLIEPGRIVVVRVEVIT